MTTTDETHMVLFRRARKHSRSAWGHRARTARLATPAREPVGVITESESADSQFEIRPQ